MGMKIINETTASNDSYRDAQEIEDVLYHGDSIQINGNFSSTSDEDWYDIFFNGLDTIVSLALMPNGNFPVRLTIRDSSNVIRGTVEGRPGEMIQFKYPLDSRKDSIKVGVEIISGTEKGDYILYCTSIEADDIDPLKDNDYAEDAQEINVGNHIYCTVDEEGDYDYFKITFPEAGLIDFKVYPGHRDVDSRFKVLDENDDVIESTRVMDGEPATIQLEVEANTVYYISLQDRSNDGDALDCVCTLHVDYAGKGGNDIVSIMPQIINDVRRINNAVRGYFAGKNKTEEYINEQTLAVFRERFGYDNVFWSQVSPSVEGGNKDTDPLIKHVLDTCPGVLSSILDTKTSKSLTDSLGFSIDMPHLLASLIGEYCPKGVIGTTIPTSYFTWAGDLASGAGHLQDALEDLNLQFTTENARIYSKLSDSWECGMTDMITDIDATNIGVIWRAQKSTPIADVLEKYYLSERINRRVRDFVAVYGTKDEFDTHVITTMKGDTLIPPVTLGLIASIATKRPTDINVAQSVMIAMAERFNEFITVRLNLE